MNKKLDINFVREQFPAFDEANLQGWAFFENAGGSYACNPVIKKLNNYYRQTKVQPYATYPASAEAGAKMDETYRRLAAYLNVKESEVHLGPSTTQNTYVLAHAFRSLFTAGDEIIVTNQDHEANSGFWRQLAQKGVTVHEWRVNPQTGILDLADLDHLLSEKTRLLAFPHCSNVIGHINPVADIVAKAKSVGALTVVDGVGAAPHGFPDMEDLGADIYLFSLYKTYGPHQGLMVIRESVMAQLANQGHYFHVDNPRKRMNPAGPDHAQVAATSGILDYFDALYAHHFIEKAAPAERNRRVHSLLRQAEITAVTPLLNWFNERPDIRVIGPTDPQQRVPTVAIICEKYPASYVTQELTKHKVMANSGHFYAPRVLEGMNIPIDPGVLRLSFVHYTTSAEISQLMTALHTIL